MSVELHRDLLIEKHQPCPSSVLFFGKMVKSVRIPGTAWNTAFTALHFQYLENILTFLFVIPVEEQSSAQLAKKVTAIYVTSVYVPGPENQRAGKCKFWGVTKLMLQLVTSQVAVFQKLAFASSSFKIVVRCEILIGKRFQ